MPKDRFSNGSRSGEPEQVRTMLCKIALAVGAVILVAGCGTVDDRSSKRSGSGETTGSETAVHSMEHGAVWITYRPGLPAERVESLRELANGNNYVLVSPIPTYRLRW